MVATCVGFGGQLPTSQTAKRDGGEWLCCFKRAQARTRVQRETSVVNRSSCYELIFSVWVFSRLFLSHGQVSILNVCVRVCVCVFIHLCFFVRWSCSGIVGSIMLSLMWRRKNGYKTQGKNTDLSICFCSSRNFFFPSILICSSCIC